MKYLLLPLVLSVLTISAFARGPKLGHPRDYQGDEILFTCTGPRDREDLNIVTKDVEGDNETILRAYTSGKFDRDWVLDFVEINVSRENIFSAGRVAIVTIHESWQTAFVKFNGADYQCEEAFSK